MMRKEIRKPSRLTRLAERCGADVRRDCPPLLQRRAGDTGVVYPTGVTIYDPTHAYNCYVLIGDSSAGGAHGITHLIDMDGHDVHSWDWGGFPSKMMDPKTVDGKRGVIGVQISHLESKGIGVIPGLPDVYQDKEIGLVDWDGKVLWQGGSKAPGGGLHQHHDWATLPNGNVLALGSLHHAISGFGNRMMFDDVIYEMNKDGDIVWKWTASEHLNELGFYARATCDDQAFPRPGLFPRQRYGAARVQSLV